jgi:hypothetical protein
MASVTVSLKPSLVDFLQTAASPGGKIVVIFAFFKTGLEQIAPKMIIQTVRTDFGNMVTEFFQRMSAFACGDSDQCAIFNREAGSV